MEAPNLRVRTFDDGALFLSQYDDFLHRHEIENNIILGNTLKSIFNPTSWRFIFLAVEEAIDGKPADTTRLCALYFASLQCLFFSVGIGDTCYDALAQHLNRNRMLVRECQGPIRGSLPNDDAPPKSGLPNFIFLVNRLQNFEMKPYMSVSILVLKCVD